MAIDDTILVINDYSGHGNVKRRTSSTGRQRVTISIRSEPILVNTDGKAIAAPMVDAIAQHFRDSIDNTTETPKPNTLRARQTALKAFVLGKKWAMDRYGGGRTGSKPPARTESALQDSRRLRDSIKVSPTREGWIVNIASNRLNTLYTDGEAGLQRILEALRRNIPGWGNGRELMDVVSVRNAFNQSKANLLRKVNAANADLGLKIFKQVVHGALRFVG